MSESTASGAARPGKALHIALWVAQVLLAGLFTLAGFIKATSSAADLAAALPYAGEVPLALIRFIGISELAGALGMILPAATRIAPRLTPLAGIGLATVMVLATGFHIWRGEFYALPFVIALGAVAAFVAWGRLKRAPIAPRG